MITIPVSIVMLSGDKPKKKNKGALMESTKDLEQYTYDLLAERGVTLEDIAELVLYVQNRICRI